MCWKLAALFGVSVIVSFGDARKRRRDNGDFLISGLDVDKVLNCSVICMYERDIETDRQTDRERMRVREKKGKDYQVNAVLLFDSCFIIY